LAPVQLNVVEMRLIPDTLTVRYLSFFAELRIWKHCGITFFELKNPAIVAIVVVER
jgi:hypothetical protein